MAKVHSRRPTSKSGTAQAVPRRGSDAHAFMDDPLANFGIHGKGAEYFDNGLPVDIIKYLDFKRPNEVPNTRKITRLEKMGIAYWETSERSFVMYSV